ncbi:MAG: hypothetical protein ACKUBY_03155 [Candidatus Moraniibacteriota bacterium]|jgi:hypothetical protein
MKRQLTEKEKKVIKGYNLSPQIEQIVWDTWSEGEKPAEMGFVKKMVGQLIGLGIVFGSSVALWVNYLMPGITQMHGVLNIVRFFFWIVLPLVVLICIVQVVTINKNEKEAFKKFALDSWQQKRTIIHKISKINQAALVIGFILNGYFVSAMMTLVCFLAISFIKIGIRSDVQKIMDKVVPPQNDDIIEAEYSSV